MRTMKKMLRIITIILVPCCIIASLWLYYCSQRTLEIFVFGSDSEYTTNIFKSHNGIFVDLEIDYKNAYGTLKLYRLNHNSNKSSLNINI